ncbi:hypothetical protein SLA2020_404350 [Shorea laevis]
MSYSIISSYLLLLWITFADLTPRILEASLSIKFCPKAIILVASAGYGLDHIAAVDILRTIKSANGFTIVVI